MIIRNIRVDIDIYDYIEAKGLDKIKVVGENIMCCCPFHDENSPSFGIHSEDGQYNCFGCGAKGSFAHLVKYLDKYDTVYDAETALIEQYGRYYVSVDEAIELEFIDENESTDYWISNDILKDFAYRHPYLERRGIVELWQRRFQIGYSKKHRAITIPWRDELGRLLAIKYRSVIGKQFWYAPVMPPGLKKETLWSLDKVIRNKPMAVALTEAEIDCMSVWQAGATFSIGACALGGSQLSREQAAKLINYLPSTTEVIVFTDNDEAGDKAKNHISDLLSGRFRISEVDYGLIDRQVKDANDLSIEEIEMLLGKRTPMGIQLFI